MKNRKTIRPSWRKLLGKEKLLQLPAAHDALTAKLIEQAGFKAYQVGGFALDGGRFAVPDIDLTRLGEKSEAVREIIGASELPVLVDCDDGYGDVKNVTYTIRLYEDMGVSAVFIEDQQPPKRCGHMAQKRVVSATDMAAKSGLRSRHARAKTRCS
jgi:2-methylisocitrate lyase-like PEP mutase family enzyme